MRRSVLLGVAMLGALSFGAQAADRPSAEPVEWQSSAGFVAIRVASIPRSTAWYTRVLGLETIALNSEHNFAILRGPGLLLEVQQVRPPAEVDRQSAPRTGPYKFGVVVDDLDRVTTHLAQAGVALLGKVIVSDADNLRLLAIADPDGNIVQIFGK